MTRIDHEETTNEFFGGLGNFEVFVGEREITAENVVDGFLLGVVKERRQSTEQNVENDSKRPHVSISSNRAFGNSFWWKKLCSGLVGIIRHVASDSSQL